MREPVAHLPRHVDPRVEAVLGPVGLVDEDDDVRAVRDLGEGLAPLGAELLDGGEDDSADLAVQLLLQVGDALGLDGSLAQDVAASTEGAEELLVEIVAIGEHHHRGVLHPGVVHHSAREERHQERLARSLGVPEHAPAPVALPRGMDGLHALPDGVELVVARDLLDRPALLVLEDGEPAQHVEERSARQEPARERLDGAGVAGRREVLAVDRAPPHEPVEPG